MKIKALQKLTLLDFPGNTACTVFTPGCNLRCPFCHNARLVLGDRAVDGEHFSDNEDFVSQEEFFAFLKKREGLLDGVCITGGEPLLQSGIEDFIGEIKRRGFAVKLDTNGFFPDRLEKILQDGNVDYVAMDIKSAPETYGKATGLENPDMASVRRSVELLKNSESFGVKHEFRTTVVKGLHQKTDIEGIAEWLCGEENYYLQMFTDSGELVGNAGETAEFAAFSRDELAELTRPLEGKVKFQIRGL